MMDTRCGLFAVKTVGNRKFSTIDTESLVILLENLAGLVRTISPAGHSIENAKSIAIGLFRLEK